MSITCWLTRRRLGAFQDGELPAAARARTAAHVEGCRDCAGELVALGRLRGVLGAALATEAPEPSQAVWQTFWPQVRARLQVPPAPAPRRPWWLPDVGRPRLALGSAVAVAALAVLAVLAPWQKMPQPPVAVVPSTAVPAGEGQVVVQSVETTDPESSVMVFTSPEADMTVVWVFGLEGTEI